MISPAPIIRALVGFAAIAALTVVPPWLLILMIGNPYPPEGISLSGPVTDGALLGLIAVLAWLFWGQMLVCLVIELVAGIRASAAGGSKGLPPGVPGTFRGQQQLARLLVRSILPVLVGVGATTSSVAAPLQTASITSTSGTVTGAEPAPAPAPASAEPPRSVTARRGDTLWGLAERHLGSGEAWREIAGLNRGRKMADGAPFDVGTTIRQGWQILLPSRAVDVSDEVVVQSGDTLWGLAEEEYGDGERWSRLYEANDDQIDDPDLIFPGQRLDVPRARERKPPAEPGAVPGSRPPNPDKVEPAPPRPTPAPTPAPDASPAQGSEADTSPTATGVVEADTEDAPVSALQATLLGGGALLGAGLTALLLVRRRQQYARRRSGRTVARTPAHLVEVEAAIRTADVGGSEFMNLALRNLVDQVRAHPDPRLPDVVMARLDEGHLDLHLRTPMFDPPPPWTATAEGLIWSVDRSIMLTPSSSLAPYPTLAAIGTDDDGGTWLLDLEAAGIVEIEGDGDAATDLARFVSAELAVNAWSDSVHLDLDEFAKSLLPLRPERLSLADSSTLRDLLNSARRIAETCARIEGDVLAGRLDGGGADTRMPTVAVLAGPDRLTAEQIVPLQVELGGERRAVALVVVRPGGEQDAQVGTRLHVDSDGILSVEPHGLRLTANRLSPADAADLAQLLSHHDEAEDEPMPVAAGDETSPPVSDAAGALLSSETGPRSTSGEKHSVLPLPNDTYLSRTATTEEDLAVLAPAVPEPISQHILALDCTLEADVSEWHASETPRPRLRVLGPVELRVQGEVPKQVARRRAYNTELVAFIAMRPHGATPEQLADAFGSSTNTIHSRVGELRQWLGRDPSNGEWYLPESLATEASRARGVPIYEAPDVLCDADLFRRLRIRAQARGSDGIEDLKTALDLVEGRPFDQLRPRGYGWLAETPVDHQLTAAIVDVAHLVSTHCLAAGDTDGARWAAEKGMSAAPMEEKPRLDLIAALVADGRDVAVAQELIRDLYDEGELLDDDEDPTARTAELLARLGRQGHR